MSKEAGGFSIRKAYNWLIVSPVVSLILAFLIGGILMQLVGYDAVGAYKALVIGSFGSKASIIQTLGMFTPVAYTGIAYAIALKAGVINLGAEGQFLAGAMGAALAGAYLPKILPYPIGFIIPLILGVAASALIGLLTAGLKRAFNADVMLISLMLNYVINLVTNQFAKGPFQGEGSNPATPKLEEHVFLPLLAEKSQLHLGFIFAIILAIILTFFLYRTAAGFEFRTVGANASASRCKGISISKVTTRAILISSMVAGFGGACMVLGVNHRFMTDLSPGYGWDGVAASLLGGGEPIGTLFGALVFGAMRAGSVYLGRKTKIPGDFIFVIEGLLVILIATPYILKALQLRNKKGGED